MYKYFFYLIILIHCFQFNVEAASNYDLTIIGRVVFSEGIGRHSIQIMDMLHDKLKINFKKICTGPMCFNFKDVPNNVQAIIKNPYTTPGNVSLYVDILKYNPVKFLPNSTIKLAFSVFESTLIPQDWVKKINWYFDGVVVPDKFLVEVYKKSGVRKPIFVLPLNLFLDKFLQQKSIIRKKPYFTFGMSAEFYPRKNHELLLEAFIREFSQEKNVKLYLHGRGGDLPIYRKLMYKKYLLKAHNVEIIHKRFSEQEYISFMSSLDCYAFVSAGEGFSITPREALACSIPCILSDNSAHSTICKTGLVRAIPATLEQDASMLSSTVLKYPGKFFSPTVAEVRKALRDVYENYSIWKKKAVTGKEWVKQYLAHNLKDKYLTLIKPKKVILGTKNKVKDGFLITNSRELYEKYQKII